jgi:hypothetical protein
MARKALIVSLLTIALLAPGTVWAAMTMNENLAMVAMNRADDSMGLAVNLFQDFPSALMGNEMLTFRSREMPSGKWFRTGYVLYEKAWDRMVEGRYEESVRLANLANDIFSMLIKESKHPR